MTGYPTCSTCKHWARPERGPKSPWSDFGECAATGNAPGSGRPAVVVYDSLTTLPSFGCLLHSDLAEAGA